MRFNLTEDIPYSRELVFRTHRDKLLELVPYMPNVASVDTRVRAEPSSGIVCFESLWTGAASDVPALLRPIIRQDMLTWVDRATWDENRWRCDWEIQLSVLPDAITARGVNLFEEEDGETLIHMHGEFIVHPERIRGVPLAIARRAAPAVERFVVGVLRPNLRKSNRAVQAYIDEHT